MRRATICTLVLVVLSACASNPRAAEGPVATAAGGATAAAGSSSTSTGTSGATDSSTGANPATAPAADSIPDPIRSVARNAHPGFDTRRYPGDAALRAWAAHSPYEWVAYYLVAPCQTGPSWVGKRNTIRELGYGTAVVFIGEQDWAGPPSDSGAAARSGGTQCTVANLTTAKGSIDAARADSTAAAEGFPEGTIIYLDIERVETLSQRFTAYIRSWVHDMLVAGRYTPGIYVHERNAEAVHAIVAEEYAKVKRPGPVPYWVAARPAGAGTPVSLFDLNIARPASSGFSAATIWQGAFNISESWGGVTLLIDANIASQRDPSSSR